MNGHEFVTRPLAGGAAGQSGAEEFVRRYSSVVTSALRRFRAFGGVNSEESSQNGKPRR